MASDLPISFVFAGLPEGYCFTSFSRFGLDLVAQMAGYVGGSYSLFNFGNDEPAVNDRTKPWLRTNADGTFDKIYVFAGGVWVSTHYLPPGTRIIAPSTLLTASDVWAWDGGSGDDPATTTPTFATGAMWEVDPILTAKFPLGAGTLPSGAVVAPNATGGAETHALVAAETPAHTHFIASDDTLTSDPSLNANDQVARRKDVGSNTGNYNLGESTDPATLGKTSSFGGDGSGVTTPHNNMPVYAAVLFIRRTNRTQYTP